MPLQWTEDLAVGHAEIDAQHRSIFDRFADFLDGCSEGMDKSRLLELFDFLDTYVSEHFQAEQDMMERLGYPGREVHLEEHRRFVARLEELKTALEKEGVTVRVLIRTNKALIYWLTEHIREVDTGLAEFLRQNR